MMNRSRLVVALFLRQQVHEERSCGTINKRAAGNKWSVLLEPAWLSGAEQ